MSPWIVSLGRQEFKRSWGRQVRSHTEICHSVCPKDPVVPMGGECFKAYPGQGNRSIFYPGSSVDYTLTTNVFLIIITRYLVRCTIGGCGIETEGAPGRRSPNCVSPRSSHSTEINSSSKQHRISPFAKKSIQVRGSPASRISLKTIVYFDFKFEAAAQHKTDGREQ